MDPILLAYYDKFKHNSAVIHTFNQLAISFFTNIETIMSTSNDKAELKVLYSYLNTLDQKHDDLKTFFSSSLDSTISSITKSIVYDIQRLIDSKINPDIITDHIKSFLIDSNNKTTSDIKYFILNEIHKPILDTRDTLIHQLSKLPIDILSQSSDSNIDSKLQLIDSKWSSSISLIIQNIQSIQQSFINDHILNKLQSLFDNTINDLKIDITKVHIFIDDIRKKNESQILETAKISHSIDSIQQQLLTKNIKDYNTLSKGKFAESKIFDILYDKLTAKLSDEVYTVQHVGSTINSCDILVKSNKNPDIRIEVKNYTHIVDQKQIDKFKKDLSHNNTHGIFISIQTGIFKKGNIEIEPLTNGKFAIYLSNNNYNEDSIINSLQLIYKIDSILFSHLNPNNITIPKENLSLIQIKFRELESKINIIKDNIKSSITMLNNFSFEVIEQLLFDIAKDYKKPTTSTFDENGNTLHCSLCDKTYVTKSSFHQHKCKSITSDDLSSSKPKLSCPKCYHSFVSKKPFDKHISKCTIKPTKTITF